MADLMKFNMKIYYKAKHEFDLRPITIFEKFLKDRLYPEHPIQGCERLMMKKEEIIFDDVGVGVGGSNSPHAKFFKYKRKMVHFELFCSSDNKNLMILRHKSTV